jgi:hypothetical protein
VGVECGDGCDVWCDLYFDVSELDRHDDQRAYVCSCRPAITSKHFGPAHFGLSWGMLSVRSQVTSFRRQGLISASFSTFRHSAPSSTL